MTANVHRESAGAGETPEELAALLTVLARCFEHPDEETAGVIESGRLGTELRERARRLGLDMDTPPDPEDPREAYLRTFESYEGEYAPPAESAYREWWDGTERGILSGPPAHDMRARYEELGAEIPAAYPADHVSLLLEYGSLLLESGHGRAYLAFHDAHFEWIPAFRRRIERTAGEPFYRWAARTLEASLEKTREAVAKSTGGDRE